MQLNLTEIRLLKKFHFIFVAFNKNFKRNLFELYKLVLVRNSDATKPLHFYLFRECNFDETSKTNKQKKSVIEKMLLHVLTACGKIFFDGIRKN